MLQKEQVGVTTSIPTYLGSKSCLYSFGKVIIGGEKEMGKRLAEGGAPAKYGAVPCWVACRRRFYAFSNDVT